MLDLRPYQSGMIDEARIKLRAASAVLIQSATGSGKTVMAAKMCGTAASRGIPVFFSCHRDFLLQQTSRTFDKAGIPHSFIAAGYDFNPHAPVQICSIDTLKRRLDRIPPPGLFMWDEAHHTAAAGWAKVREWCGPRVRHIGFSATPIRLDGKGLDTKFDDMVVGPSTADLIEQGYLSEYKAFAPSTPDLHGVHTRAGDYARDEIETVMDEGQIIGDMVRHYRKYADGMRTIYFCVSIAHSKHVAATFKASGIAAEHIDGTADTARRITTARAFALGELRVLTNVDLFGEGYDLAAQADMDVAVEAVALARPTKSLALHLQQIGRALRPSAGKTHAVILDHAGNLMRHGLPDQDREWTLAGIGKGKGNGAAPVRQCPVCFGVHPAQQNKCPYCGHVYETQELGGRVVEEVAGELKEIDAAALRRSMKAEERSANTLEGLVALARRRGYKNPEKWAGYIWTARTRYADQLYAAHGRQ